MTRKAIIHNRRFYWLYPDGRRERIYANERIRSQISQHAAVEARVIKEEAPPRRTNHPPRPPGTMPTLPPANRDHDGLTLSELAHQYGWGSVYRFSEALRKSRRSIYDAARAVGRERANANLMTPKEKTNGLQ